MVNRAASEAVHVEMVRSHANVRSVFVVDGIVEREKPKGLGLIPHCTRGPYRLYNDLSVFNLGRSGFNKVVFITSSHNQSRLCMSGCPSVFPENR